MSGKRLLFVGAGYCGSYAATQLASNGYDIFATTRDYAKAERLETHGCKAVILDFEGPEDELPEVHLDEPTTAIVSVPPGPSDGERSQERRLAEWLLRHNVDRCIYWSATSVYPNLEGELITDESPVGPDSDRGRRRLDAENVLRDILTAGGVPFESMRLVGIYGPGRNKRGRIASGEYRFPGDGRTISNRIHRDDVLSATLHVCEQEAQTRDWVVSDGEPFEAIELIRFVCAENDLDMPISVPLSDISPRARSFWQGNRRIIPRRLFETGWTPTYPNFRRGLLATWREEDDK